MAGATSFLGNTVTEAAAFAAGFAIRAPLSPLLQALTNETWSVYPDKPLDASTMAGSVAEGKITQGAGAAEAALTGISASRFASLVTASQTGPGVALALDLARRALIDPSELVVALQRAGLEEPWINPIAATVDKPLDPAVIALAITRGNMTNPEVSDGPILTVGPPTSGGNVPSDPVSKISPLVEASLSGITGDRLAVMTRNVGLPMSAQAAASAYFRGIIAEVDFDRAIAEGDTRNEWRDAILAQARTILSPTDYVAARLRNWIDDTALYAGTGQHGMSEADTDLAVEIHGRPLSWHQVFIGLQRGGVYNGPIDDIDPAFLKSLQESDIRPEWYNLAWAQRYSIPGYFVLKPLTASGALSVDQTTTLLTESGWEPSLAASAAASFATTTTSSTTTPTKAYTTAAVKAISKDYIDSQLDADDAKADLTTLEIPDAEQTALLAIWDVQRKAAIKGLSAGQLRTAYSKATITKDVALSRLEELGYSAADAETYLDS